MKSTLIEIDLSPVKTHAVCSHSIVSYGKKKVKQAKNALEEKQVHIKAKIAETLQLCESDLDSEEEATIAAVTEQKAKDLDQLMKLVKEKMIISKRADKLQLLTLVPSTWKVEKICQYFSVTHYMVKQSRQLLQSQGILSKPTLEKEDQLVRKPSTWLQNTIVTTTTAG